MEATLWSLEPRDLIYFLLPDLYGPRRSPDLYWKFQNYLKTIYVGPAILCLAVIYFFRQGKRGVLLLVALGVTLIIAFGAHTPVYPFFHKYIPLFSTLRYPVKFLFLFVFYLCLAAGLGLDVVRERFSKNRHPPYWFQGLLIGVILLLAALLWMARLHPDLIKSLAHQWGGTLAESSHLPLVLHNFNRMLAVTVLLLMVVFFGMRHRLVRLGSPLLLILLTLDLFLGNRGYAIKLDSTIFHAENEIIRTLRVDPELFRFHVLPQARDLESPVKTYGEAHQNRKQFLGNDLMIEHHLFDITGYNVPLQPRYERLIGLILNKPLASILPLLDMLNVKYVLTEKPTDLKGLSWVLDGPETSKLYENQYYLPRAFLAEQFEVLKSDQEFARAFHELTFDPRRTVLLEKEPVRYLELKRKPKVPDLQSAVKILTFENNRIVLKVDTPEAAFLFMSETHYPGWKAYVDDREEEILRANYVFRAIPMGPGSHLIEVVYEPLTFRIGLAVSLLTIVILLAAWTIHGRRRRATLGIQESGGPERI